MKLSVCVDAPLGVVTTIGCGPAVPLGALAVMEVADFTTMLLAEMPPMVTALFRATKSVPVMVMAVPPVVNPEFGVTALMVGAGVT